MSHLSLSRKFSAVSAIVCVVAATFIPAAGQTRIVRRGVAAPQQVAATPSAPTAAFTAGDIVVCRVGDGVAPLANTGNAVFLDEYTQAGALVQSIALPASGANAVVASGTATSECLITRSVDGQSIVVSGYNATPGGTYAAGGATTTSLVASTTTVGAGGGTAVPRIVALVAANGTIDTSTTTTQFSATNIRSATRDGSNIWMTGANSGVIYTPVGGSGAGTVVSTTVTNNRATNIFGGQLYATTSSGATFRLWQVGTGEPTTTGQTGTELNGVPGTGSPYQFIFADLSNAVAGLDTLYIADDTPGTIVKYSLVGGTWTATGTITATGIRGLTGINLGAGKFALYGATGASTSTGGGTLYSFIDTTGYNGTASGTATSIATAGANTAFRGVALAPGTPTAAGVTVAGHVTAANGSGIRNARVSITDQQGNVRSVTTNAFGYYSFDNIVVGDAYVMGATARGYNFTQRLVQVFDSLSTVDFRPGR